MNSRNFSLKAFPSDGLLPGMTITGNIARSSDTLNIRYELLGDLSRLAIPALSEKPERRKALWEETCFEFFIGAKDADQYWEFNLSPAGHWNVYHFISYRQGMQEEPAFASLPYNVEKQPDSLLLSLNLDPGNIIPADQLLNAGTSAVIRSIDGKLTFWALNHPGPQPDFHRKESFLIEM